MSLRMIGNRQEPAPGSRRHTNMKIVHDWLLSHPNGAQVPVIMAQTGLTRARVDDAILDLKLFSDLVVSPPAPRNDFFVRAGWNQTAQIGEAYRSGYTATMMTRAAVRHDKEASAEPNPARAALLRMISRNEEIVAAAERDLTLVLGT